MFAAERKRHPAPDCELSGSKNLAARNVDSAASSKRLERQFSNSFPVEISHKTSIRNRFHGKKRRKLRFLFVYSKNNNKLRRHGSVSWCAFCESKKPREPEATAYSFPVNLSRTRSRAKESLSDRAFLGALHIDGQPIGYPVATLDMVRNNFGFIPYPIGYHTKQLLFRTLSDRIAYQTTFVSHPIRLDTI